MTTKFRNLFGAAIATAALATSAGAWAGPGTLATMMEQAREQRQQESRRQESAPPSRQAEQPRQSGEPRQAGESRRSAPPQRDAGSGRGRGSDRPRNDAQPAVPAVPSANSNGNGRRDVGAGSRRDDRDGDRNRGDYRDGRNANGYNNDGGRRDDTWGRGNQRDRDRDYRSYRPPRVVARLPAGYRHYDWNGSRYFYHGGSWYRPYGTTYISIGVPYGLFVGSLFGSYTSFWYGNTRYYYSDHTYYTYEPVRRGYVVARSPYGDDEYADAGVELYVYPAQGQSEQQQADDRYECHRWAVEQTGYDPLDDEYDEDLREDYMRATTACLTGRGYTVY